MNSDAYRENLLDLIYKISTAETPLSAPWPSQRKLAKTYGASMKKRRRRVAKPLCFSPYRPLFQIRWEKDKAPMTWDQVGPKRQ